MAWPGISFGILNTCDGVWWNWVRQNRKIDEEIYEDCVKTGFQLDRIKIKRDIEAGSKSLGMEICSINIWNGSKLELAWTEKSSSYFKNSFPIFLLTGISNLSIFKVRDALQWENYLVMKTFSNIIRSCGRYYLNIIICHLFSIIAHKFY